MEHFLPLITHLVAGLIGGHVAGAALNNWSLGLVGNSIAGLIGGGVLGQVLQVFLTGDLGIGAGGPDIAAMVTSIVGGGVGGALLTIGAGLLKSMLTPKA